MAIIIFIFFGRGFGHCAIPAAGNGFDPMGLEGMILLNKSIVTFLDATSVGSEAVAEEVDTSLEVERCGADG